MKTAAIVNNRDTTFCIEVSKKPPKDDDRAERSDEGWVQEIGNNDRETFCVLCLDTKGNLVNLSIAHIGTLNQTLIHNREIFKIAVLSNANKIIVGHNHPSGELEPSSQDIEYTEAVIKAGNILGIEVLDHIIVNSDEGISIRSRNSGTDWRSIGERSRRRCY